MMFNIYFFEERPGRLVANYIGTLEAKSEKEAVRKAASLCWSVSGASLDYYCARDVRTDDWKRPRGEVNNG